jgi:serine/threonine protein kinase HipA of HipAB toxin-antitoxin module
MAQPDPSELESSIRGLSGVLGCVVLANPDGTPAEIQAFTKADADREQIERAIVDETRARGLDEGLGQVFVFELEAEREQDPEALHSLAEAAEREARSKGPLGVLHALGTLHSLAETAEPDAAAAGERVPLRRVLLSSSSARSEAEVVLEGADGEVTGVAEGEKSPHGLTVVAEATLQAATQISPNSSFALVDAALREVCGRQVVAVLVREPDGVEILGAALVRSGPITEATVRATLDAVNRRLGGRG